MASGLGADPVLHLAMAAQRPQRVGQGRCSGVVAGAHEDDQVVADLVVGQRPPGRRVAGRDQRVHQRCVPGRIGAARLQDVVGESERVAGGACAPPRRGRQPSWCAYRRQRRGRRRISARSAAARRSRRRVRRGRARAPIGPAPAVSAGGTRCRGRFRLPSTQLLAIVSAAWDMWPPKSRTCCLVKIGCSARRRGSQGSWVRSNRFGPSRCRIS